jgi:hypothetical protein
MFQNVSKFRLYQTAAWYSFLGPLAAVAFFVAWNHGGLLEWVPSDFLEVLLLSMFSAALALALATMFGLRCIVPRPVKEIAYLGAAVSALLLFLLTAMLTCSH